jgi:hypothetical protein
MSMTDATGLAPLTAALREMADALASADLARLLDCEARVALALDGARDRPADRASIEEARGALLRCKRLGASLMEYTRLSLDPNDAELYARTRGAASTARTGSSLEARG